MEIKDSLKVDGIIEQPMNGTSGMSLNMYTLLYKNAGNIFIIDNNSGTITQSTLPSRSSLSIITFHFKQAGIVISGTLTTSGSPITVQAGSTAVFRCSTVEAKLLAYSNNANTGDETSATIKTKLGSANSTTDGYLSFADWNAFNNKMAGPATSVVGNIPLFNSTDGKIIKDSGITLVLNDYIDFLNTKVYAKEILARYGFVVYDGAGVRDENDNTLLGFIQGTGIGRSNLTIGNSSEIGVGPGLYSEGSEENIDINLYSKGTGKLLFNGREIYISKYVLKSNQFTVTGTGSTHTVNYTTFASTLTGVKQYKIFQKQTGTINIDSDTPAYTGSLTSVNFTITTGVEYKYIVVADFNYYGVENINSFTNPQDIVYTVDGMQINGTSAVMSWGAVGSGNTYTIQYSEGQTLSATPTEVTTTDTTIVLSGLTPSNTTTGELQYYTFKIIAKNSGGVLVGDSTPTTSYILSTPAITSAFDSSSVISGATATKSGTIVTMTTPTSHGLVQGDIISIGGAIGFGRTQVFVSSVVSPTVLTYTSVSAGATTATNLTLTKYVGFKKVWNYYPFRTALASLEVGQKRILPRIFDIYRNPSNYASELIFPVAKYTGMGVVTSSWYALEPKIGDGEKVVIVDNNGNSSILMKRSTYTIEGTPLMRFTSVVNDDHRGYKVVHGGGIVVDKGNSNSVGGNIWMTLDTSFNENLGPINYPNVPSELLGSGAALPVNFLLSGYTVFFDGVGQRIIIIKKDGTGKTIIPVSSVAGLALAFTTTIANFTYAIHDNISDCTIGVIGGSNVYKLRFNWNTMTCSVVSTISGITQNYNATEENALGYEFMTHFDLDKNACSIITYKSGVAGNVTIADSLATFTTYSDFVNDPGVNMILPTVNNSGSTQCGMNPVWMMDTLGSIYWVDWGHDDNGLYGNVNDAGLGIVKMKDMSIHPRLVSNI